MLPMGLFQLKKPQQKKPARRELTKEDVLLAQRIKQLRRERGFTQEELSDLLGVNTSYYARIVDRIDAATGLPLERDHYDVGNALWRKQIYQDVATIDGVLTPTKVRIEDVQSGDWSELVVNDLHYDVQVPEAVFDAQKLVEVSSNPLWSVK